MAKNILTDAKVAAIRSLQSRLTSATERGPAEKAPGSESSRDLEKAIDYLLSPARNQERVEFLAGDAIRNARFAGHRSRAVEARAMADIVTICAPRHKAFDGHLGRSIQASCDLQERSGARTSGPGGRICGMTTVDAVTPEHIVEIRYLTERLRAAVSVEDKSPLLSVLDGMLAEETVSESSRRLGLSPRTVDRLRAKVRLRALDMLSPDKETIHCHRWNAA